MIDLPAPRLTVVERTLQLALPSEAPEPIGRRIASARELAPIARELIGSDANETTLVFTLDAHNRLTGFSRVAVGTINTNGMLGRDLFMPALLSGAAAIVLAHNHPSGNARPSQHDRTLFTLARQLGVQLGMPVLDHLIVTRDGPCFSLASSLAAETADAEVLRLADYDGVLGNALETLAHDCLRMRLRRNHRVSQ